MKQPGVLVLIIFVAAVSFVVASQEAKNDGVVKASLTGWNEVNGPGDPDGAGVLKFTVKSEEHQFCYELTVTNIAAATEATINFGERNTAGSVLLNLNPPTNERSEGCVSTNSKTIAALAANPTRYYVNVTNAEFPNGAVRGQLR